MQAITSKTTSDFVSQRTVASIGHALDGVIMSRESKRRESYGDKCRLNKKGNSEEARVYHNPPYLKKTSTAVLVMPFYDS